MTFFAKHHTNVSKTWDWEKMELHNLTNVNHFVYIANPSWNFLCKFKYMYWEIIKKKTQTQILLGGIWSSDNLNAWCRKLINACMI